MAPPGNNESANASLVHYAEAVFGVADYVVFAGFLSISISVGIFFSVKGHKNTSDYFFGGRQMKPIPVGISNGVSFLSAIVLVGYPSEIYINGSDTLLDLLVGPLSYFLGGVLIAVVIHPLHMLSLNQYFQRRFRSQLLTYVANVMVLICIFEYMGSCMLGSVVAFNSITGGQVSVVLGLVIAGVVGIFYTSIGGLKAVVWTDVIQSVFMVGGVTVVVIKSILDTAGGMETIVEMNHRYQRVHPVDWSTDITVRHTAWGITIGKFMYLVMWPIQPAGVQRLCSTANKRDAILVAGVAGFMYVIFAALPLWAGLNIFGYYASRGCDVFAAGWLAKNEIVLYYVRERLNYPGFQGLFVAALFSGSLSSFSSGLSAASAIMWKDTIFPLLPFEVSELKATLISKILVVVFGVLSMMWCYALYTFGGLIIQLILSIDASMYGAYFGLFILAICFRHGNYKGALAGLAVSFTITLWLGLGSVLHGQTSISHWPTIVDRCGVNGTVANITLATPPPANRRKSMLETIYSISYVWLPTICVAISLVVSLVVTACTAPVATKDVDPKHLLPVCRPGYCRRHCCRRRRRSSASEPDDESVRMSAL